MILDKTAEVFKYLVRKDKVLKEVKENTTALMESFASRGFIIPPGPLGFALLSLTVAGRSSLSEQNMEVVKEQIGIELQQTEHDIRVAVDEARMRLSQAKQDLMDAFILEIAEIEASLDMQENELNMFALEIERRQVFLVESKTAMEIEKEKIKQETQEVERRTWDYEKALAQARIETIEVKLGMIPFLEAVLAKEREVLAVLQASLGDEQRLIDAERVLIEAKELLLPYISDKANKRMELADAHKIQVSYDIRRAVLEADKADLRKKETDAKTVTALGAGFYEPWMADIFGHIQTAYGFVGSEFAGDKQQRVIANLRNDIELERLEHQIDLAKYRRGIDIDLSNDRAAHIKLMAILGADQANIVRTGQTASHAIGEGARKSSRETAIQADLASTQSTSFYRANTRRHTAIITAKANVTSTLTHYIGSK